MVPLSLNYSDSSDHTFLPDSFFTNAQIDRIKELMVRHHNLTTEERDELETLIDAELEATVARTESLPPSPCSLRES
jgi:hypothetical protein